MAVPHYSYLKMKMPSSKGIITVAGDYRKSIECAMASSRLVEALVVAEEKKMLERVVAMAGKQPALSPNPKDYDGKAPSSRPRRRRRYLWTRRTRKGLQSLVQTWTVNRKASSSTSSVRIEMSSHGPQRTCRASRRISPSTNCTSEPTRSRSSSPSADCQKRSEES